MAQWESASYLIIKYRLDEIEWLLVKVTVSEKLRRQEVIMSAWIDAGRY